MEFLYVCKYCGMPSQYHPSDQEPPADYCHEGSHVDESITEDKL
jgi:hypothetical protein